MEQRKNISLALMIITFGFILLGLGMEIYFKQQMITVSAGTTKSLNPKLESDVLGVIKEGAKDTTFTPPAKLPF